MASWESKKISPIIKKYQQNFSLMDFHHSKNLTKNWENKQKQNNSKLDWGQFTAEVKYFWNYHISQAWFPLLLRYVSVNNNRLYETDTM